MARAADPAAAAPAPVPAASSAPAPDVALSSAKRTAAGGEGSASPAKSARRILFRCLHCRSTLSIRPVDRTSKLKCPHCTNTIYVTPTGRLLKNSPSVALRKGEVAPTELLTPGAGSVVERNPGSVAIKKTGNLPASKAVPKKAGSAVGLRATAYKEPARPEAADSKGARFLRPGSDGSGAARKAKETAPEDVGMASINPATSWMPKPPSAFQEHQENKDPGKTAFITEERTGDLTDLASSEELKGVAEQFMLPAMRSDSSEPSPRLQALLPDDGSDEPARRAGTRPRARHVTSAAAARPHGQVPRQSWGKLQATVRGLFLMACLCAPLLASGLVLTKQASASAGSPEISPTAQSNMLERMGGIVRQGVRHLLGSEPDPYR
jgi:hypothetical protein